MITFSNRNAVILWWLLLLITPTSSSTNPSSPLAHSKKRIFDQRSSAKSPPLRLSLLAFSAPPTTLRRTPPQCNIREYTTSPTIAYPQPPSLQKFTQLHLPPRSHSTRLHSFLGSDGGILGVGAPELATIVLIGYFVLGPTELYKLTKEIGKFVNNFRSVGTELTGQFTDSMENQLALDEVRKAQEDLTEAFSFRRSINWEEENEGVNENVENFREVEAEASAATATATATATASTTAAAAAGTGKKKIRKRVKKREPVPLETVAEEKIVQDLFSPNLESSTEEDARVEDMISNSGYIVPDSNDSYPDLDVSSDFTDSDNTTSSTMLESRTSRLEASENSRFAAQLNSEAWNESIIENEDALSPLSKIMEKLALLEDERNANLKRLEEEMRLKEEVEERFYREKRKVLEEGIEEFQRSAMLEEEVGESNIV